MESPDPTSPRSNAQAWQAGTALESGSRFQSWRRLIGLGLVSCGLVLSHYLTPAEAQHAVLHDIYRRVLYVPIILAAFWFGFRGGLICALLIAAAYFPHIYHDWGGDFFDVNLNRTLEATMYIVVGVITGALRDHLFHANRQLHDQANHLKAAMSELTEKTREVFEAEQQLRQADRLTSIGQLTTGLAHEIRNPLGSIRGAAEILSDPDTQPEHRREFGQLLIQETQRLDNVLGHFLDYAKTQRSGDQVDSTDLTLVIDRLLTLMDKKLKMSKIRVTTAIESNLPSLAIAESLLQQVLVNVVLNAQQAMPEGGRLDIHARVGNDGDQVLIQISDTGPGIPPRIQDRIFDPFFTTKEGGTGLGLSIVHKIVNGNRGAVSIDPDYREGTRITIGLAFAENRITHS